MHLLALALTLLALVGPAAAADLPPELEAWAPWVLHDHPDHACPTVGDARVCAWPGDLALDAGADGGTWALRVYVERDMAVRLPGGMGAWPQEVREGLGAVVVTRSEAGHPMAWLQAGAHTLRGRLVWSALPQALAVPPTLGRVALRMDGVEVAQPQVEGDSLILGTGGAEDAGRALEIEVSRRIVDGVPLAVDTHLVLRASGTAREVDLGAVSVEGAQPVSLDSQLPARFTPDGHLVVQARPGTWTLEFTALHKGPATTLRAPSPPEPWPARETWAVLTDDRVRAVTLGGVPAVDPGRTSLPAVWRDLPTFLVEPGAALELNELRRGEPEPPPNQLELRRVLRLDADGGGFTVEDSLSGTLHQDWRLDLLPPGELGHVSVNDEDQVITHGPAGAGIEVRSSTVALEAESRLPGPTSPLPAVGWSTPVQSLSATVHLPPGWQLVTALGVDRAHGSLFYEWSLFDALFVLLVALALGRLYGWHWAPVAAAGLALARHQEGAPMWLWAVLLAIAALERVVREGWLTRVVACVRWSALLVLVLVLAPFAVHEVQTGLAPILEHEVNTLDEVPDRFVQLETKSSSSSYLGRGGKFLSMQQDPGAVVQTGPGVPSWTWRSATLQWDGPVEPDHAVRLLTLGPAAGLVLALLRVLLLVALLVRMAELRRLRLSLPPPMAAAAAAALLMLAAPVAWAQEPASEPAPAEELLLQLERRLKAPPDCHPRCASASVLSLRAAGGRLEARAEVHAAAPTSWPLPGPAAAWTPTSLTVDGRASEASARLGDGLVHVRLEPGVHTVVASGPLHPGGLTLQLGDTTPLVRFSGEGWQLEGVRPDGSAERSLQLSPILGDVSGTTSTARGLSPWIEVRRELDLGLPWRVRTTVTRRGTAGHPLSLRVPVLDGESVTDERLQVDGGAVLVSLDRDRTEVSWISALEETERVELTAPWGVPWTEEWSVSCSPVFACESEGLPPLEHVSEGHWSPRWRPWPGEKLVLTARRPEAVQGQTVTIDGAHLELRPGSRLSEAELRLDIRSSQGGQQAVVLPEGARLQSVSIDGLPKPVQADGRTVPIPLRPGAQDVVLTWQSSGAMGLVYQVPRVDLGVPAVDAELVLHVPRGRWVEWAGGPTWGPVVLLWARLLLVFIIAPLLARIPWVPLSWSQWAVLGVGLCVLPVPMVAIVVVWLVALGARKRAWPVNWWRFDLLQLALVLLGLAAMGVLYGAIHAGLLMDPMVHVEGYGSSEGVLRWYADRVDGTLPQPTVLTAPLWTWRVIMLIWSLWLVASLVRWLPWAWRCLSTEGLFRLPPHWRKR